MMILHLNTADIEKIRISIHVDGRNFFFREINALRNSKIILYEIKKLLKENKLIFSDLDAIEVHTGKGSFTGVRSGVSIANALSYGLGIPVNSLNFQEDKTLAEPSY